MADQAKLASEWFDAAESDYKYAQIGLKEDVAATLVSEKIRSLTQ